MSSPGSNLSALVGIEFGMCCIPLADTTIILNATRGQVSPLGYLGQILIGVCLFFLLVCLFYPLLYFEISPTKSLLCYGVQTP